MRDVVAQVLFWSEVVIAIAAGISTVLVVWRILRQRDQDYQEKYQEFLEKKRRVEDALRKARGSGS